MWNGRHKMLEACSQSCINTINRAAYKYVFLPRPPFPPVRFSSLSTFITTS